MEQQTGMIAYYKQYDDDKKYIDAMLSYICYGADNDYLFFTLIRPETSAPNRVVVKRTDIIKSRIGRKHIKYFEKICDCFDYDIDDNFGTMDDIDKMGDEILDKYC